MVYPMRHDTRDALDAKTAYEDSLENVYGPPPLNIFKALRQSCEYSHDTLASRMYTSKQSLIRLEQGCFDTPLPVALDYWVNRSGIVGITELSLVHQYEEFQELMRQRHRLYFGNTGDSLVLRYANEPLDAHSTHPLVLLRKANDQRVFSVSVTEVSKALCLHQSTLQHWETKWRLQKTVPRGFQQCLLQLGYTTADVRKFCEHYIYWRNVKLGRINGAA